MSDDTPQWRKPLPGKTERDSKLSDNCLSINRCDLLSNAREIKRRCRSNLLVVIKARAYGFGLVESALLAVEAGADYLGLTSITDAVIVRGIMPNIPILIMSRLFDDEVKTAIGLGVEFWVCGVEDLLRLQRIADSIFGIVRVHAKFDIGLARFGVEFEDVLNTLRHARELQNVEVVGLASHLTSAGGSEKRIAILELQRFVEAVTKLDEEGLRPPIVHVLNSSGFLRFPDFQFDMVRIGALFYGFTPTRFVERPIWLKQGLRWTSLVRFQYVRPEGTKIGYGGRATISKATVIGVLPIGFSQGFRNTESFDGNRVMVGEKMCAVLGFVGLDNCLIDIGPKQVRPESNVTLLSDEAGLSIEDLAVRWNIPHYEVPTTLRPTDVIYI